jgi:hypothetical protein
VERYIHRIGAVGGVVFIMVHQYGARKQTLQGRIDPAASPVVGKAKQYILVEKGVKCV